MGRTYLIFLMQKHWYLITSFNDVRYLESTVVSLLRQYPSKDAFLDQARLLIIDDASRDGTQELITKLTECLPNISVQLNQTNKGISATRNLALQWLYSQPVGNEDVALFVDGDDLLTRDHLKVKLACLARDPQLECVGGQLGLFYDDDPAKIYKVDTFSTDPQIQAIAHLFECHFYIANALFKVRALVERHAHFPQIPTSEDWQFFAAQAFRMRHVPEVTLLYRRHERNLTNRSWNAAQVLAIRKEARELTLRRAGMTLSDRECELLDLVGYLSFRIRWMGPGQLPVAADVHMPWFSYLEQRPEIRSQWRFLHKEIGALFARIEARNASPQTFEPAKLAKYLATVLGLANRACTQPQNEKMTSNAKYALRAGLLSGRGIRAGYRGVPTTGYRTTGTCACLHSRRASFEEQPALRC
ncbi:MAG: glycosyltransferase [Pusillimonas sp.]|nr:MAG: glycosyltransferase [Pusillimonas sp.]